jgi:1,4-dihydroxy-2-naphthoyl-CoA hydrolase
MSKKFYRQVFLNETDAAGVIYFANLATICHQIYEQALIDAEINLNNLVQEKAIALPIIHTSSDFFQPIFWGDRLLIQLEKTLINQTEFELTYQIFNSESELKLAQVKTIHVAINITHRKRTNLPEIILEWLKIS